MFGDDLEQCVVPVIKRYRIGRYSQELIEHSHGVLEADLTRADGGLRRGGPSPDGSD